jgi:hypothetical protein
MSSPLVPFRKAAKFDINCPHVLAAWNYLEDNVDLETKIQFASILLAAVRIKEDRMDS